MVGVFKIIPLSIAFAYQSIPNVGIDGGFKLNSPSMLKCGNLIFGKLQSKWKNPLIFSIALETIFFAPSMTLDILFIIPSNTLDTVFFTILNPFDTLFFTLSIVPDIILFMEFKTGDKNDTIPFHTLTTLSFTKLSAPETTFFIFSNDSKKNPAIVSTNGVTIVSDSVPTPLKSSTNPFTIIGMPSIIPLTNPTIICGIILISSTVIIGVYANMPTVSIIIPLSNCGKQAKRPEIILLITSGKASTSAEIICGIAFTIPITRVTSPSISKGKFEVTASTMLIRMFGK